MRKRFYRGQRRCEAGFFGRVEERARREVQRGRTAAADSGTSESSFLMTAPPELRK